MHSPLTSLCLLSLLATACEDPPCPNGYEKLGSLCKRLNADAGAAEADAYAGPDGASAAVNAQDANFDSDSDASESHPAEHEAGVDGSEGGGPTQDGGMTEWSCDPSEPAFECAAGHQALCTTTCGTKGTGACTQECRLPGPDQCTPPTETCNWTDDDCDGVTDPGMLERLANGVRAWTQPSVSNSLASAPRLLSSPNGGAWLLYGGDPISFTPGGGSPIQAGELAADGTATGKITQLAGTDRTLSFTAEVQGAWIAVLAVQRTPDIDDSKVLKLLLYRSDDLTLVDELALEPQLIDGDGKRNDASDDKDCPYITMEKPGMLEDGPNRLRLLLAYDAMLGSPGTFGTTVLCTDSGTDQSKVVSVSYLDGSWTYPKDLFDTPAVAGDYVSKLKIGSVPCKNEWLVGYANVVTGAGDTQSISWEFASVSSAGVELLTNLDSLDSAGGLLALYGGECKPDAMVHGVYAVGPSATAQTGTYRPYLRRWTPGKDAGSIVREPGDLLLANIPLYSADITETGGRFFVAGLNVAGGAKGYPALFEVSSAGSREVQLSDIGTGNSWLTAVTATRNALILAVDTQGPTPFNAYRAQGDTTNNAVAVTYRLGCP